MKYLVYIMFSKACNKFYTGHTQDLENRLWEHDSGKGSFTSRCLPWTLVWSLALSSRGEAMKLENKIKKRGAKRFLIDQGVVPDVSRGA